MQERQALKKSLESTKHELDNYVLLSSQSSAQIKELTAQVNGLKSELVLTTFLYQYFVCLTVFILLIDLAEENGT